MALTGGKKKKGGAGCSGSVHVDGAPLYGGKKGGNSCSSQLMSGGKKKPKKAKKGKRKLSEYTKFVKKHYKVVEKENPKLKATEIISLVAKKWRESKK
jgi:hypothetical protein